MGDIVIHAGKRWGRVQRDDVRHVRALFPHILLPEDFELGGIVGAARIMDCVSASQSPWFNGPYGFVLTGARPSLRFLPWKGQLGFFQVPANAFDIEAVEPACRIV